MDPICRVTGWKSQCTFHPIVQMWAGLIICLWLRQLAISKHIDGNTSKMANPALEKGFL